MNRRTPRRDSARAWRDRSHALLVVAVVATVAVGVVPVGGVDPGGSTTEIDSCTTVDAPGHYVLAADLTHRSDGACVVVAASDVTLDGRGHVLDGGDGDSANVGVRVGGQGTTPTENVTIRDLSVTGFGDGVTVQSGGSVTVADVAVADVGGVGLSVDAGGDVALAGVRVEGSGGDGVALDVGGTLSVTDATVTTTGGYGVYVQGGGAPMTFESVRVTRSTEEGFEVLGTGDVSVDGLTVSAVRGDDALEPYDAVFVNVAGDVTIENATVRSVPGGRGVYVYASADDATVRLANASVEATDGDALVLGSFGESTLVVADVVVAGAGGDALAAGGFRSVRVRGVAASDVTGVGLSVDGSTVTVENTSLTGVGGADLRFPFSTATLRSVRLDGGGLDGLARAVALDAREVVVPDGFDLVGAPVAVTRLDDDGVLDAEFHYATDGDESAVGLYRSTPAGWSAVPDASVDRTRDVVSTVLRENATVAVLLDGTGALAPYATDAGVVDDAGLTRAIDDWVRGRIDDGVLSRAVRAWVRGSPVG